MTGDDLTAKLAQLDTEAAQLLQEAAQPHADKFLIKQKYRDLESTSKLYEKEARDIGFIVIRNAATRRRINETRARMARQQDDPAQVAMEALTALQRAVKAGTVITTTDQSSALYDAFLTVTEIAIDEAVRRSTA